MNKFKKINITNKISLANNLPLSVIAGPRRQAFRCLALQCGGG